MSLRALSINTLLRWSVLPLCVGAYIAIAGLTGFCPMCQFVTDAVVGDAPPPLQHVANRQEDAAQDEPEDAFNTVQREGGVDLEAEYDLSNAQIPIEDIHTLLPRDAIPALTDPDFEAAEEADWLRPTDEVIAVVIDDEAAAFPIRILDFHEVANVTIAGNPVAVTWCPLCKSATVISRKVPDGEVLEFGVSGALYNSNVLMYDRTHKALWSQLGMQAVTGPMAGQRVDHYPVRIVSWRSFRAAHPDARVLSINTGHERPYEGDAYAGYFATDRLLVPVRAMGEDLPKKTLGVGVLLDGSAWFVPADAIGDDDFTLNTPAGPVVLRATDAGVEVVDAPEQAMTAQTFYYAWSAFNPRSEVVQ